MWDIIECYKKSLNGVMKFGVSIDVWIFLGILILMYKVGI